MIPDGEEICNKWMEGEPREGDEMTHTSSVHTFGDGPPSGAGKDSRVAGFEGEHQ